MTELGPVQISGHSVRLRLPRFADVDDWCRIRLRDQQAIEPFWVASSLTWQERHTRKLWVRECLEMRRARRKATALSFVIECDGRFAGQCGLTSIDLSTGQAELGIWIDSTVARGGVGSVAASLVVDYAFDVLALYRVAAITAVGNMPAAHGAERIGFVFEARMDSFFEIGTGRAAHELRAIIGDRRPVGGVTSDAIARWDRPRPPAAPPNQASPVVRRRIPPFTDLLTVSKFYLGSARQVAARYKKRKQFDIAWDGPATELGRVSLKGSTDVDSPTSTSHKTTDGFARFARLLRHDDDSPALTAQIVADRSKLATCRLVDVFHENGRLDIALVGESAPQEVAEGVRVLIDVIFTKIGLRRVFAILRVSDITTAKIIEAAGMTREGTMTGYAEFAGKREDHDLWAITTDS
ncbi:GNAT family N-acetyltransferase [Antrihabitans stalactiti]|uniref:GNAT family N-acetyltransferase n=1 Tax=Antrihabitans stalactiti TaxID=2584121 RepID=UPI00146CD13A